MSWIEVEEGLSINTSVVFTFEEIRAGKVLVTSITGEEKKLNVPYEQFKTLVGIGQSRANQAQNDLRTLAKASFTPRP